MCLFRNWIVFKKLFLSFSACWIIEISEFTIFFWQERYYLKMTKKPNWKQNRKTFSIFLRFKCFLKDCRSNVIFWTRTLLAPGFELTFETFWKGKFEKCKCSPPWRKFKFNTFPCWKKADWRESVVIGLMARVNITIDWW